MRVVVVGCGRAGAALATRLDAEGDDVRAIDTDPGARRMLPASVGGKFLTGNGLRRHVLDMAGTGQADAVVALTDDDSRNIVIARIAREGWIE